MARLNHSCDADVFSWIQQDSRNVMIVSSRPIKTGQEIQICYKSFHECLGQDFKSPESVTMMISLYLKCNWLIVCPPDCICKDKSIPSLINTFGRLQKMAYEAGSEGHFMRCLMYLEKLLELIRNQPVMKGKVSNKISLIHDAMCASAMINGKEVIFAFLLYIFKEVHIYLDIKTKIK